MTQPTTPTTPTAAESEPEGVDFRLIFTALRKYAWVIVALAVVCAAAALFITLRLTKVYRAEVSIEFDPAPTRPLGQQIQDVASPVANYWATREWMATQQEVITSRRVCEAVVQRLALHRDPVFFGIPEAQRRTWQGVSVEVAAAAFRSRVHVVPVEDTRIVNIQVTDSDPERAATFANEVANAYLEKTRTDRSGATVSALEWLSSQLDAMRSDLNRAEIALYEFKDDHHVLSLSLEDRINITAADVGRYSEALTAARTRRISLEARLRSLRETNDADPMLVRASAVDSNPTVATLRDQYRATESERSVLAQRYGDAWPAIQQLDAKLTQTREQMRAEIAGILRGALTDLREAQGVEGGLQSALNQVNEDALQLSLDEIEFNSLTRDRENKARIYGVLLERTTDTSLTRLLEVDSVRILDRALKPGAPISPNMQVNVAGGAGLGLALGILLAIALTMSDRTIKSQEDVEALGISVLGIVPIIEGEGVPTRAGSALRKTLGKEGNANRDLYVHTHPTSATAECCRAVRTNLTFSAATSNARSIMVTSSSPQEGKTTVAVSLAISLAQLGKRVILLDTDLRRPRIHRSFGLRMTKGITSVLVGDATLDEAIQETQVPNLWILPCGPIPPNPSELLHTPQFSKVLEDVRARFDQVVLDSPPLAAVTDAAVIGPQVGGTIVVARFRETHRDMLASALRQLRDVHTPIYGAVINGIDLTKGSYGYGRQYYYRRDGYSTEPEQAA